MAALSLEPRCPEGRLGERFAEEFGSHPAVLSGHLAVTASHDVAASGSRLWSRDKPVFWDSAREEYVRIGSAAQLEALASLLRCGRAWPAVDDCLIFEDREGVHFFASSAGASTFYYTERDGVLLIAIRPQAIRSARAAPVDRLGLGEIVRFGANYGRRTLLRGVNRIPIGHVLSCTRGRTPEQRAYITFSHRPESGLDEQALREAIAAGLDRNLALIEGPRDLLFSGGVDSALLALRAVHTGFANRAWFYSVSRGDPERAIAQQAASTIGLDLKVVHDETTPEDIADRIGAYALPTLDFSILPTYALGSAVVESRGRTTFIDGTGGDAWFGFGSLAHASRWLPLHRFRMLSPAARRLYLQILRWEHLRPLRLVKGLARTPNLPSAALGHLCANPVYSSLLDLTQEEWREIECDLLDLMRSLTGGEVGSAKSEVIVSDATLIAVAQFAAKTSQWDLAGEAGTFYPFLMPNLVALGQKMPPELLLRGGTAKPLLKDLVAQSALGHSFAYRRKSGFQPPLQRLLQDESAREILFSSPSVGVDDSAWTKTARELPERLLSDRNTLRIGGLYPIWAAIAIKLWLKSLRQLGA
jgi:asparagine synthetase B (glutamine-hydrolysing)